jgi:hypothetical protein
LADNSFFGLDLQTDGSRLAGAWIGSGSPITREIIEETARRIIDSDPPTPCGFKGNPHLVAPRPVGQITYCIQCGYPGVRVSETEWRNLNEEELGAGVSAMQNALKRPRRR